MNTTRILRYLLIGTIILIIAALIGWYVFLQSEKNTIAAEDAARGAGLSSQSFAGRVGSTYENIVSSLTTIFGNTRGGESSGSELQHVTNTPIVGIGPVSNEFSSTATSTRAGTPRFYFVERSTGNVLAVSPENGALARLTNTLVPQVFEATIVGSGRVLLRGVDGEGRVVTSMGTIATSSQEGAGTLAQKALPRGIQAIAASPDGEEVFYILSGPEGTVGIRATWDGSEPEQIFSSALSGWKAEWLSDYRIILVQNASDNVPGYAYTIEENDAALPLLRNIPGLTVLAHPTSRALLYGISSNGLFLYAQASGTSTATLLPIRTTAEKCVWSPSQSLVAYCAVPQTAPPSNFLALWYRGEIHTRDAWWRVDISAGRAEPLYVPPQDGVFDVENPIIDKNGSYIAFVNAIDKTPKLLRIEEEL